MLSRHDPGKSKLAKNYPLVQMREVQKAFPGVQAIKNASFELNQGEIHALVGENGAGKSTLLKILSGVHFPDSGIVNVLGQPISFQGPLDAMRAGMATIYQELTLVPTLTVAANIFLGHEKLKMGLIDSAHEFDRTQELIGRLGADINPDSLISELTLGHKQIVEIARALARDAKVLIMDEPTAALAPREVSRLFEVLRELSTKGMGVVFVSHRLDEVLTIADRITVMRDGLTVSTRKVGDFDRSHLIKEMVGRSIEQEYYKEQALIGEVCLEVRELTGENVNGVSFTARSGEVLGIAGLLGAGRTETARLIFGADQKQGGEVLIDGQACRIDTPNDAVQIGICLLTEDRKTQGLVLRAPVLDNFSLPSLGKWSRWSWINRLSEETSFQKHIAALGIRISDSEQPIEELSGGNQQKVLVARWLETNSRIILFDEPTRGIDVGAKYDMYVLISQLASQGKVVIVISSELPELLGICDRILVMRHGKISGEISDAPKATQEQIMALAV